MPEPAYTVHDTPKRVARIEQDLETVIQAVRRADPGLRSLVLTGGFARGEGALLGDAPQNDYDFVAVRGLRRPRTPYAELARDLERRLDIHVDLAPVAAWRLSFVRHTIFWYETALRGRILWGEDLLGRIPIHAASQIDPAEGLRLLVNRAAGLLLVTESRDPPARRLQAAKGFLAALDARLLALNEFPPSQTERWHILQSLRFDGIEPSALEAIANWIDWAYRYKVDPAAAAEKDPDEAWHAASKAILDAVPVALQHARLPSLEAYARRDGLVDHLVYYRRAANVPDARRLVLNPTGRVRVATLRLLEAAVQGRLGPNEARHSFARLVKAADDPVRRLDALRRATLQ